MKPRFLATCGLLLTLPAACDRPSPIAPTPSMMSMSARASQEEAGRYVVTFAVEQVPAGFAQRVANVGGSVSGSFDGIGVAIVDGLSPDAATQLAGAADVQAVEPDRVIIQQLGGGEAGDASTAGHHAVHPGPLMLHVSFLVTINSNGSVTASRDWVYQCVGG